MLAGGAETAPEEEREEPARRLVLEGDAIVETRADLEEISRYSEIGGKLVLKRAQVKDVSLPLLESIGGKLSVRKNMDLKSFRAPLLKSIGKSGTDDMIFESNPALASIEMPVLETVAHSVIVRSNQSLEALAMPALTLAPGDGLDISSNGKLRKVTLPELRTASHVTISDCASLRDVSMGSLEWVDSIRVERNRVLASVSMPRLGVVHYDPEENPVRVEVTITDNPVLKDLEGLAHLTMIGRNGPLVISGNSSLPSCRAVEMEKRLAQKGWRGKATICGNAPDECGGKSCKGE